MTGSGRLLDRVAFCSSRITKKEYISVSPKDVEATVLEEGDDIRVMIHKTDNFGPVDRDIFETSLRKSQRVYIPTDTMQKLELEPGDIVKYIIIPKKSFPGVSNGPVRNNITDAIKGESDKNKGRPERVKTSTTFSDRPMQQTGQLTIPSGEMEDLGLVQGDSVKVTIMGKRDSIQGVEKEIGTSNRITITKDERERLGLEAGDEPLVRLEVREGLKDIS